VIIARWYHLTAGHPANKGKGQPGTLRTFMGRNFGTYEDIRCQTYSSEKNEEGQKRFNLTRMIKDYDVEAGDVLNRILQGMTDTVSGQT
jgi:hypothetical protein